MSAQDVPAANTIEFKLETELVIIRKTTHHQSHTSLHSIGRGTNVGLERRLATSDKFYYVNKLLFSSTSVLQQIAITS
jgi:hypothetical protein